MWAEIMSYVQAPMGTHPGHYTVCVKRDSYVHERKPLIMHRSAHYKFNYETGQIYIDSLLAMCTHTYYIHSSVPVFNIMRVQHLKSQEIKKITDLNLTHTHQRIIIIMML